MVSGQPLPLLDVLHQEIKTNEMAKQISRVNTITYHFQQNLPLPHLSVGNLFYVQPVYVFGIHGCGDNDVTKYCWPETTARQGNDRGCIL